MKRVHAPQSTVILSHRALGVGEWLAPRGYVREYSGAPSASTREHVILSPSLVDDIRRWQAPRPDTTVRSSREESRRFAREYSNPAAEILRDPFGAQDRYGRFRWTLPDVRGAGLRMTFLLYFVLRGSCYECQFPLRRAACFRYPVSRGMT